MAAGADTKQLLLQVSASTELAQRNLSALERSLASDAAKMGASLGRIETATTRTGVGFGALKANAIGFLAGVGISGIASLGKAVLDFADDLGTAADQAGVAVERYQTLKEGLRSLEVGTEATDKILKTLSDTIGKVQSGVEDGATKALDKLGISAKITSGEITTADQLLDALAASATSAGTATQFTAALVDVVGKKYGIDLAAALRDGGTALHATEQAFRDTGSVITSEMIDKLADANEAIDSFEARAKQGFTIFAANAISSLDSVVLTLLKFSRTVATIAPLPGMGSVAEYTGAIRDIEKRQATPSAVKAQRAEVQRLKAVQNKIGAANGYDQGVTLAPATNALKDAVAELQRMSADLEGNTRAARADAPARVVRPPAPAGPKATKSGGSGATKVAAIDLGPDLRNLDPRASLGVNALPGLGDISTLKADLATIADLSQKASLEALLPTETQRRLEQFAEGFTQDLSHGLADAIVQGHGLGDVLVSSLQRAAAEALSSGFSKLLGGGISSAISSVGSSIFGGFRAGGGPVSAGVPYIVGEKRAELFVPRVPGDIIPSVGGRGGGTTVHQSFDLRGAVVTEDLYKRMQGIGIQAAQAGAQFGRAGAAADLAQMAKPRLPSSMG